MSLNLCKSNIPRLLALLLAAVLVFSCAPAALAAESGTCGDGLEWSFDGSTLTISGAGSLNDYSEGSMPPWYGFREQILRLSLPDGLTRIGAMAFYDLPNLTSVSIPGSVEYIGEAAFCLNKSMTMLTLREGLRTISRRAFEQSGIQDLRLPGTVITLGSQAFYYCPNLSYASIPASVNSFGSGLFAYCENLARVDMAGDVSKFHSWTFYGCDKLTVVNTQDSAVSASAMKVPQLPKGVVAQPEIQQPTVSPEVSTTPDPTDTNNNSTTTVQKTDNSTTVTNVTTNPDNGTSNVQTDITATVVTPEGWDDVVQQVENAEITQKVTGDTETVTVTVYTPQTDTVPKEVVQEFAGKDVTLTVQTESGGQFTLDCEGLGEEKITEDLNLSYTLELAQEIPEMLAGCTVYKLAFHNSASILAEIIIRLPGGHSRQTASLYQIEKNDGLNLLQSVMVDDESNAHWYLKSVDHKTEYLIGMNVPGANASEAIIPEVLYDEYKVANVYDGVEYVVTGRSSSWGMNLGQVMGILAAVMVGVIVLVGFVMYLMNKRRLAMGYVPELDEEDYL